MTDPVTYFWIAVSVIILLVDLWAIISVFRSDKADVTKAMWRSCCSRCLSSAWLFGPPWLGSQRAGGGGAMGLLWFESEAEWE